MTTLQNQCQCEDFLRNGVCQHSPQNMEKEMRAKAFETGVECELVLDHDVSWCGDCYACSICGLIFSPKKTTYLAGEQAMLEKVKLILRSSDDAFMVPATEKRFLEALTPTT